MINPIAPTDFTHVEVATNIVGIGLATIAFYTIKTVSAHGSRLKARRYMTPLDKKNISNFKTLTILNVSHG